MAIESQRWSHESHADFVALITETLRAQDPAKPVVGQHSTLMDRILSPRIAESVDIFGYHLGLSGRPSAAAGRRAGDPAHSLVDVATKVRTPLEYRAGYAQFSRPSGPEQVTPRNTAETFADNVPGREVIHVALEGFAARWDASGIRRDPDRREQAMKVSAAEPAAKTSVERNVYTTIFTQPLKHPRLLWGSRQVEWFHGVPRARVTVRFHRTSSERPEWFFLGFALPCGGVAPVASCGGMEFQPFADQIPNTCGDYFGIDGWIAYPTPSNPSAARSGPRA